MPIDPRAIDKFLHENPPYVPQFKKADPDWLRATIFDCTGKAYKPRTKPRPHQLEGIAFALYQGRSLLYYSMRLGKTLIALQWAEQLKIAGLWRKKGLVICHAPIALDVWASEAELHSRLKVTLVRNQIDEFIDAIESDADLIVVPWSGLQNIFTEMRQSKKGKNKLYPDFEGIRIAAEAISLGIIDEIHSAKNHTSLRFLIAKELLKECHHRLGLTGTPFGRNPFDTWAQAYLIDGGKTLGYNFHFFQAAFGRQKKNYFSGLPEFEFDKTKQKTLEERLAWISLPYRLEECQQVPTLPGHIDLRMTGDQRVAYEEAIDKIIKLREDQQVDIRSTFVRMRQISSGYIPFVDPFGNEVCHAFKENAKLDWLRAFLPELIDTKASSIIIHEYTFTGSLICDLLTEMKVSHGWLHGPTKDKTAVVRDFQARKIQIIVVQAATGSLGIDLHVADHLLFFESPVSPIVRAQAEARPLSAARGDRTLLLDDLTCSGVERKILEYIKSGKDLMSAIIHDRRSLKEPSQPRRRP